MSIGNQRNMLTDYVQRQGWQVGAVYIDEGYSGTNFQRSGFLEMIADIEKGKINLVIVKDLSRLERNYILCGQYTEIYFPERNVRFIAVNDGVDTINAKKLPFTRPPTWGAIAKARKKSSPSITSLWVHYSEPSLYQNKKSSSRLSRR